MPNIDAVDGIAPGVGVDLGGQIFGDAVLRSPLEVVGGGQRSEIYLTLAETQDDLHKAIDLSTEVSAAFGVFGGSAKFDLAQSMQVHAYSITLVIRATVLNAFSQMRDVRFGDRANQLLQDGDMDGFRTQFGDYFVRGLRLGGELCAILQIIGRDEEDQSSIKATLQAHGVFGAVTASTDDSFSSLVSRATKKRETKFKHIQVGGDQKASIDPIEMVNHALTFATSVRGDNSELYSALALPYTTVDRPAGPNYIDVLGAKDNVEIIMRSRRDALTRLADFQFVLSHPEQFDVPVTTNLNAIVSGFETAIGRYTSAASRCVNHPKDAQSELQALADVVVPTDELPPRRTAPPLPDLPKGVWSVRAPVTVSAGGTRLLSDRNGGLYALHGAVDLLEADNQWAVNHPGQSGIENFGRIEHYDPDSNSWAIVAPMPVRLHTAAVLAPSGEIFVTGEDARENYVGSWSAFDPKTTSWRTCAPMPSRRTGTQLTLAANGKIYAIGGRTGSSIGSAPTQTVEEYDPATDTWKVMAPRPAVRDNISLAAAPGGKVYALGGFGHVGGHWGTPLGGLAILEEFDPAANSWTTRTSMRVGRSGVGATVALNGRLYAVGGGELGTLVEEYDPATDTWTEKPSLNRARLSCGVATATDGTIYVAGGFFQGTGLTDMEAFLP